MKIVTYLRVSTADQDHFPQRLELADWAARNGAEIVEEFEDTMSGAKADRPGLRALMKRCAEGGIEAVACVKLDRLGRSVVNVVGLIEKLESMGVAVIFTTQGIDTRRSNLSGRMQYQIFAAIAEFERGLIRERTVAGLAAARAKGVRLGRPSPTLVAYARRGPLVDEWIAGGRVGGLRGLARLLGGCSPMTARSVLARHLGVANSTHHGRADQSE